MAVTSASSVQISGHSALGGGTPTNTAGATIFTCVLQCVFTGTYAQADNSIISAVPTAIQNSRRDGRTAVLLDVAFGAPGLTSTATIGAKTVAVSTADITLELTTGDLTTEHANAAISAFVLPMSFLVTYTLA